MLPGEQDVQTSGERADGNAAHHHLEFLCRPGLVQISKLPALWRATV